ncbi:MAG TPA: hypothetical protein VG099_15615 [Gemmataceae bacterium]|jgi:hypothetical protein|nr:hypothetical protein [Gemmataceae bacterium]
MNWIYLGRTSGRFAALLALLALFALVGCGGSGAQGKLTGKVLYKGKPVTGGSVIFRPSSASENTVTARIDPTGNYTATVPAGVVKIAVDNRELQPPEATAKKEPRPNLPKVGNVPADTPDPRVKPQKPAGTYIKLPDKYHDVASSGLSYTVKSGAQNYDINLEEAK